MACLSISCKAPCSKRSTEHMVSTNVVSGSGSTEDVAWRRHCGCLRTSDKLNRILNSFPAPPPPTPNFSLHVKSFDNACKSGLCKYAPCYKKYGSKLDGTITLPYPHHVKTYEYPTIEKITAPCCDTKTGGSWHSGTTWRVVTELVQLVQLAVTATALALYYLIFCYMQLVYYTLKSAMYFHNADGPMKITIGVVTVTSLVVGFNLILRLERITRIIY